MIREYIAYLKDNPEGYWFKPKLFGWGWVPVRWEGWFVTLVFAGLIIGNFYRVDAWSHSASDTLINVAPETVMLFFLFFVICWKKGEWPHWNWGIPEKYKEKKG